MPIISVISTILLLFQMLILARIILGFVVQYMGMQGGGVPDVLVKVYDVVFAVTEPALAPIRRILPQTGMIDFSPLVLIIVLVVIRQVLLAILN